MPTPIDKQQITITSAVLMIIATFGAGGGLAYAEQRLATLERKASTLEQQGRKLDKLALVICLDTPQRVARCRELDLLQ